MRKFFVILILSLIIFIFFIFNSKYQLNFKNDSDHSLKNSKIEKLLCVVLTTESNIKTRGVAVWNTWGQQLYKRGNLVFACNCPNIIKLKALLNEKKEIPNDLIIFKSVSHLPVIHVNVTEDKAKMGKKVIVVLKETYEIHYKNNSNWYYMVDDDAYVFVDNLYKFIKTRDTDLPFMYGFHFKHLPLPGGHIGGGSGILLTDESLKRLVKKIDENGCNSFIDTYGDVTIGGCGYSAGVIIGNSSDVYDRPRFHFHDVNTHFHGPIPKYLFEYGVHNKKIGKECCSLETIAFHYIKEADMYKMHENKNFLVELLT